MDDRKKLYEEALVKEIMFSTALCVQELLHNNPSCEEETIQQFIEENYQAIIRETLEEDEEDDAESDKEGGDEAIWP